MEIEVITKQADFAGLREEWNELLSRSATKHIFLTHEWQYTWWEHFGTGDKDLLILMARENGRLVGVAPLRRDVLRVRGVPLLKVISFLLGSEADYRDFLMEEGRQWDVLHSILKFLGDHARAWHLLSLMGVCSTSASSDLLPVVSCRECFRHFGEIGGTCPFIPIASREDGIARAASGGALREYGRKLRKLEREHGSIALTVRRGEQVTRESVDEFLRLHAVSWENRGGSRAINTERIRLFHRNLVERMRSPGWPLLSMLTLEGKTVAVIYGYLYDGVFYDYLPGFDPAFQQYSPGAQVIMRTVEYGIREGWREFDLMRGDEAYKFHFTRRVRHLTNHYVARSPRVLRLFRLLEAAAG